MVTATSKALEFLLPGDPVQHTTTFIKSKSHKELRCLFANPSAIKTLCFGI